MIFGQSLGKPSKFFCVMYERILRSTQNVCVRGGNKGSNFVLEINFYNNIFAIYLQENYRGKTTYVTIMCCNDELSWL